MEYAAYVLAQAIIAARQKSRIDPSSFRRAGIPSSISRTRAYETDDANL